MSDPAILDSAAGDDGETAANAEKRLRETEEKLELAMRAAGLTAWEANLRAGAAQFDPESAKHLGQDSPGPFLNGVWLERLHPGDRENLNRRWREHVAGESPVFECEFRFRNGDAWRWVRSRGKVMERDASGRPTRAAGVNADITAEREAREALGKVEAAHLTTRRQFESILSSVPIVVWALDADGVFTFAGGAALGALGLRPAEVVGHSVYRFGRPEPSVTAIELALSGQPSTGRSVDGEIEFENHYLPVRDAGGAVVGVTSISVDVTERSRTQEALVQGQKLESLGLLAGGIAHDFNNILVGILGNASLLSEEIAPDSPLHPLVDDIQTAGRRASELARQMLSYAGRAPFSVTEVALGELIAEIAQLLRVSIGDRATLRMDIEPGLPVVLGDATQLRQVLMNLVINAGDAIDGNPGAVTLSAHRRNANARDFAEAQVGADAPPGDYVEVAVSDTGPGMDRETLLRIFDPFFSTKEHGRGLGLAAVLGIVRGHKGVLSVVSKPGGGTTFRVFLPCSMAEGESHRPETSEPQRWHGHGNVLVVDDDEHVRTTVARTLRVLGYEPSVAENGTEALDLVSFASLPFGLVVLDMTMPGLSGAETLVGIRAIDPNVPVLIVSGYSEESANDLVKAHRRVRFLQKPFRVDELRSAVAAVTGSDC